MTGSDRLKEHVRESLPRLIQMIRPEVTVPSHGQFPPVYTTVQNPDMSLFVGRIRLMVRAGFEDAETRYFDVKVETPSGKSYASVGYPFSGSKADILRALEGQTEDPAIILGTIHQAARLLQEADKA